MTTTADFEGSNLLLDSSDLHVMIFQLVIQPFNHATAAALRFILFFLLLLDVIQLILLFL